jgi:hypothetical protein
MLDRQQIIILESLEPSKYHAGLLFILGTYLSRNLFPSKHKTRDQPGMSCSFHCKHAGLSQKYFERYASYGRTGGYSPGDSKNGASC